MSWYDASHFESLQEAIDLSLTTRQPLFIPRGEYWIREPIQIKRFRQRALTIIGDWPTIKAQVSMESCFNIMGPANLFCMSQIIIDGNRKANHGISAFKVNAALSKVQGVSVKNTLRNGFSLKKCQGSIWIGNDATNCGEHGFAIWDCNAALIQNCRAASCGQSGFVIGAGDFSGGCTLDSCVSEHNRGNGIDILGRPKTWMPIRITNNWLENNRGDGVQIQSNNVVLSGLGISLLGPDRMRAVRVSNIAIGCHITGCYVPVDQGIKVEGSIGSYFITGNFSHDGSASILETS